MSLSSWSAAEVAARLSKAGKGRSKPSGGGWMAPCPAHDDGTPSLKLDDTPEGRLLYHCFAGCSPEDVRRAIEEALGGLTPSTRDAGERAAPKEKVEDPRQPVVPVPEGVAVTAEDFTHFLHGAPTRIWTYRLADGSTAGWIARYDLKDGGKEVIPHVWTRNADTGEEELRMKSMPTPRPLYNLDLIAASPDAVVVMNEGEKAADAAKLLFPDWIATAIPGGGNAVRHADYSPLAGRTVVLLCDHDGPGYEFALKLLEELPSDARVRMISWPTTWPDSAGGGEYAVGDGWDADDHVGAGWTTDLLREWAAERENVLVHVVGEVPDAFRQIHYVDTRPS